MKKIFRKSILLLAITLLVFMGCTGCSKNTNPEQNNTSQQNNEIHTPEVPKTPEDNHPNVPDPIK